MATIGGGSVTKLNVPLVTGGDVGAPGYPVLSVSPDATRVLYLADQDTDEIFELYSVPIGGGVVTKVNHPLAAGRQVQYFGITPDSTRVVYQADENVNDADEIFSVPIGGGTITKLNDTVGVDVGSWSISPDGAGVVYLVSGSMYRVPVAGGTATRISPVLPAGQVVYYLYISPDSASVAYQLVDFVANTFQLYSVPITGGAATMLSPALTGRPDWLFSPDSTSLVYRVDQDTADVFELYSTGAVADPDDDGIQSFCDACPAQADPGQEDFDTDGLGDVCDADDDNDGFQDPVDCHDTNATVWALPGETRDVVYASGTQTVSWTAPADLGGVFVLYDTLRSTNPSDFVGFGVCIETNGADTFTVDPAVPGPGMLFTYLVRAENACGQGSLGTDSSGAPRQGLSCP